MGECFQKIIADEQYLNLTDTVSDKEDIISLKWDIKLKTQR